MTRLLSVLVAAVFALGAHAQGDSRRPSANDILERLQPAPVFEVKGISVEGARPQAAPSIDLEVNFEFASADLLPDARIVLDSLGQALSTPTLARSRFKVVGHTDGVGSPAANLALSKRRAQAAADYLQREYGLNPERLRVEGMGFTQLLDPGNPSNPLNRRVQVINLGEP